MNDPNEMSISELEELLKQKKQQQLEKLTPEKIKAIRADVYAYCRRTHGLTFAQTWSGGKTRGSKKR